MKALKISYWIVTILFAGFMLFSGIMNAMAPKEGVDMFKQLQMPGYLLPFLGWAKILGAIAIIIPGFPKLKEWAYAGLMYDLIGATYCIHMSGMPNAAFMLVFIAVGAASYVLYRKKQTAGV